MGVYTAEVYTTLALYRISRKHEYGYHSLTYHADVVAMLWRLGGRRCNSFLRDWLDGRGEEGRHEGGTKGMVHKIWYKVW
jgi:hypothetical protein